MEFTETMTIGEIVSHDYRTATLFSNLGIDFCCKGHRTLGEVSTKKSLDIEIIKKQLHQIVAQDKAQSIDFKSWDLDVLADYVEQTHHTYVAEKTQVLLPLLNKISKVHGEKHPELFDITQLFIESSHELAAHMKKEELILFPFIRKMATAKRNNQPLKKPHFGTVDNPIEFMMHEHDQEGERFRKIAELSNQYIPPTDGCISYQTAFKMLEDFEKDLHKHIHLENNILFPNAQLMEKQFNSSIS